MRMELLFLYSCFSKEKGQGRRRSQRVVGATLTVNQANTTGCRVGLRHKGMSDAHTRSEMDSHVCNVYDRYVF